MEEEYDVSVIVTTPSVPYRAKLRSGEIIEIDNASLAPSNVEYYEEPIALATITTPEEYVSNIIKIC